MCEGRVKYFIGHCAPNVFYLTIGLMAHKINIKNKETWFSRKKINNNEKIWLTQ